MDRCRFLGCLVLGLAWMFALPGSASAGDLLGGLKGDHRSYTAVYLGGAGPGVAAVPGGQLSPRFPLFGPRHGGVPVVPSFNWGYFGAPYRAVHFCHQGYYDDCSCWRYRRNY